MRNRIDLTSIESNMEYLNDRKSLRRLLHLFISGSTIILPVITFLTFYNSPIFFFFLPVDAIVLYISMGEYENLKSEISSIENGIKKDLDINTNNDMSNFDDEEIRKSLSLNGYINYLNNEKELEYINLDNCINHSKKLVLKKRG